MEPVVMAGAASFQARLLIGKGASILGSGGSNHSSQWHFTLILTDGKTLSFFLTGITVSTIGFCNDIIVLKLKVKPYYLDRTNVLTWNYLPFSGQKNVKPCSQWKAWSHCAFGNGQGIVSLEAIFRKALITFM